LPKPVVLRYRAASVVVCSVVALLSPIQGSIHASISSVASDWPHIGYDDANTAFNTVETALGPTNVSALTVAWTGHTQGKVNSSPSEFGGEVYVGSDDHRVYAFKASCSDPCAPDWVATTGGMVRSSPTVAQGNVYVGSDDGSLYVFPATCSGSCASLWTGPTDAAIRSSPAVVDGVVYVGSLDGKLYAFDANGCGAATCPPLWTAATRGIRSFPAVVDGVVYVGSYDSKLYAFDANGCGAPTCPPLWTGLTGGLLMGAPAVSNGVVYIGSGDSKLYAFPAQCVDPCSPLWSFSTGGRIRSSPAVADGVVYVSSGDGVLYALPTPCPDPCSPLWQYDTGRRPIKSSPAVANGMVFVGSGIGDLFAFATDCPTPCEPLWKFVGGSPIRTSPAVARGMVFAGSSDFNLYAFGLPATPKPDIVLFLIDDARYDMLWAMPTVQSELLGHGITFSNAFVTNPLCCPSRASILTGQYSHLTGIYNNGPPHGGFADFQDTSTIATWLEGAGYDTGLFGKYLNGYVGQYIPPGWDRWSVFSGARLLGGAYFNYTLNTDGQLIDYGDKASDYSTDVLAAQADSFIRSATGPMFLAFTPFAPHAPSTEAPRHRHSFPDLEPYRPPSYNEEDISDKPAWMQDLPLLTPAMQKRIDIERRRAYQSLLAEDDALGVLLQALSDTGRLNNTLILFASDNGVFWGEHRLKGKVAPYEESIRIPLVIRYDPLTATPRTDANLVLNIDFAPTFAELAGAFAPGAEGSSLMPILASLSPPWRNDFLIEHLQARSNDQAPTYCSVRNENYSYTDYDGGEQELYDLGADPYQLQNVAGDPGYATVLSAMHARVVDLCNPPPPGFTP
jgi:N-acetylglucosamine-6-sulfatase